MSYHTAIIIPIYFSNNKKMQNFPTLLLLLIPLIQTIDLPLFSESTLIPTATYSCFKDSGYTSMIMMINSRTQGFEPLDARNVANALNAGVNKLDVLFQPCRGRQIRMEAFLFMSFLSGSFRTVWITPNDDISEGDDCVWKPNDPVGNCQYLQDFIQQMKGYGALVGIYTSSSRWKKFLGDTTACQQLSSAPLFWNPQESSDDHQPNFNSYSNNKIGGWNTPFMKRYNSKTVCGITLGMNYHA